MSMEVICLRCRKSPLKSSIKIFHHIAFDISTISCQDCDICVGIKLKENWKDVDQVLGSGGVRNGWMEVSTVEDKIVHYVLSKVLYEQHEPPESRNFESAYDLPDSTDVVKLLWCNGVAVGFYTLKLKGTLNEETNTKYEMDTLDTAYIRNSCRRKGYGTSILCDIVKSHPGEDIGLSEPISNAMWKVLYKFLSKHGEYRLRFWAIEGSGCEGFRTLIWYSMKSRKKIV
ncbi:protein FAM169B-like isoform X2 [Ischnura elegans]|uniref:protein FAM169B-like isoform X2 n=1 Tax=Ischnura elegans TaxID=197161 RepID=UPI001ED87B97|nr:protein FAM169B-like isoform X2 [Ischnura elegans]